VYADHESAAERWLLPLSFSLPKPGRVFSEPFVPMLPRLVVGHVLFAESLFAVLALLVLSCLRTALCTLDQWGPSALASLRSRPGIMKLVD
jgi:hypothetical protein